MNYILLSRRWLYDRCYNDRSNLKESFVKGVEEFIRKTNQQNFYHNNGGIICLCLKCDCTRILEDRVVKFHLTKMGSSLIIGFGLITIVMMLQVVQNMWLKVNNLS